MHVCAVCYHELQSCIQRYNPGVIGLEKLSLTCTGVSCKKALVHATLLYSSLFGIARYSPEAIAAKVKHFFMYYAINRHKTTVRYTMEDMKVDMSK